jgi:single-strand DNA-binding protein
MPSLNQVNLMGNLTRDPDVRHTASGKAVANISIAINRSISDGNGGWKEEVTFVEITVWGKSAENCGKYLTKGRLIHVEGWLAMDQWEDKESGQKRQKMKVVAGNVQFLGTGQDGDKTAEPARTLAPAQSQPGHALGYDDVDDDIPF